MFFFFNNFISKNFDRPNFFSRVLKGKSFSTLCTWGRMWIVKKYLKQLERTHIFFFFWYQTWEHSYFPNVFSSKSLKNSFFFFRSMHTKIYDVFRMELFWKVVFFLRYPFSQISASWKFEVDYIKRRPFRKCQNFWEFYPDRQFVFMLLIFQHKTFLMILLFLHHGFESAVQIQKLQGQLFFIISLIGFRLLKKKQISEVIAWKISYWIFLRLYTQS